MPEVLHLDFESYSDADLKTVGGYKYAMDPSTEVLMAAYSGETGPVSLWVPAEGEPIPYDLVERLQDPQVIIKAFNANFERLILNNVMNYRIPIERFRCVMVHAWSLSFSGGLDMVGSQLGLSPDKQKLAYGKKLINRFCKPAPRNHKAERYDRHSHPQEWSDFKQYCIQDVVAEREIEHMLTPYPMPRRETDLWFMDQRINDRGVPIDMDLVNGACKIDTAEKSVVRRKLNQLTCLENGASPPQLKAWLATQGLELPNMQKATLEKVLKGDIPDHLKTILRLKLNAGKTSTTKWHAFQRACGGDGRLRGMFSFGGAQRTQRWAGRIVQLHNLKSPRIDDPDKLADLLVPGDRDLTEAIYGDVIELLSDTIRCAITAPDEKLITVSDLGSIESRVLGWVSGCWRVNQIFAEGKDTYKDFATELFQVTYDEITPKQRKYSKPPVLGCGYGLGGKGLVSYADGMGTTMELQDARAAVKTFRTVYPEIPDMWHWLTKSCKEVIDSAPGAVVLEGYSVRLYRDQNFMFMDLPSGRRLAYYQPLIMMMTPPWERDATNEALDDLALAYDQGYMDPQQYKDAVKKVRDEEKQIPTITYMGMNQYTKKWTRISTHGGKFTEQYCQAVSRDVLAYHMSMVEADYSDEFEIVGHVHDEILTLTAAATSNESLERLTQIMSVTPQWLPGLLLSADGFVTKRYKKE